MQTTTQTKIRNKKGTLDLVIAGCDIIEEEGICLQCMECNYKPPQQKQYGQKQEEINMDKTKIKVGRFDKPKLLYLVKQGEMYKLDKDNKTVIVSSNNTIDGVVAENDIWIGKSGMWCYALLTDYTQGEYQTIDKKIKQ